MSKLANQIVYKIYDPIEKKYCSSGRGLYANNGRTIWTNKGATSVALRYMPKEIKDRLEIHKFMLVQVADVIE